MIGASVGAHGAFDCGAGLSSRRDGATCPEPADGCVTPTRGNAFPTVIFRRALSLVLLGAMLAAGCAPSAAVTDDPGAAYAGSRLQGPAPDFDLVDQFGERVRLSAFRGKVVALTFFDSRCRDVCPLTSAELIVAWRALTPEEREQVALLGVNVNVDANTVGDVAAASREWRLAEIPAWHFLTGSPEELQEVWQEYPIEVEPDAVHGAIDHTSGVILIDRKGELRWYVSVPLGDPAWDGPRLAEILVLRVRELLGEEG